METENELIATLTFNSFNYKRSKFYFKLKEDFGSLYRSFKEANMNYFTSNKFPKSFVEEFIKKKDLSFGRMELEKIYKHNIKTITIEDANYPSILKEIHSPPILLYIKGNIKPDSINIALVGTRKPTPYGIKMAERFSCELSKVGFCIVSGLARGIDTIAHKSCIKSKGITVAVLGSGLSNIYPPENKKIAQEIVEGGGAIISEYPMDTEPRIQNFPARNRIISGLSVGVIVVEAPPHSGALITASWAIEQNKEVFIIPGRIDTEQSLGCLKLAQEGAKIVISIKDILEEFPKLFPQVSQGNLNQQPSTPHIKLSENEKIILNVLKNEILNYDEICDKIEIPMRELNLILLQLEMKGLIKKLAGNRYTIT